MKTLAKYHVCNRCVIGEKTFENILTGCGKLPGLSRNGPLERKSISYRNMMRYEYQLLVYKERDVTKTGNGEPGTGNGERESGNDCTAVIPIRIQNRQFSHLFLGLRFGI